MLSHILHCPSTSQGKSLFSIQQYLGSRLIRSFKLIDDLLEKSESDIGNIWTLVKTSSQKTFEKPTEPPMYVSSRIEYPCHLSSRRKCRRSKIANKPAAFSSTTSILTISSSQRSTADSQLTQRWVYHIIHLRQPRHPRRILQNPLLSRHHDLCRPGRAQHQRLHRFARQVGVVERLHWSERQERLGRRK